VIPLLPQALRSFAVSSTVYRASTVASLLCFYWSMIFRHVCECVKFQKITTNLTFSFQRYRIAVIDAFHPAISK